MKTEKLTQKQLDWLVSDDNKEAMLCSMPEEWTNTAKLRTWEKVLAGIRSIYDKVDDECGPPQKGSIADLLDDREFFGFFTDKMGHRLVNTGTLIRFTQNVCFGGSSCNPDEFDCTARILTSTTSGFKEVATFKFNNVSVERGPGDTLSARMRMFEKDAMFPELPYVFELLNKDHSVFPLPIGLGWTHVSLVPDVNGLSRPNKPLPR